jgi:hypothetical protein
MSRVIGLETTIHEAVVAYWKVLSLNVLRKVTKCWSWQPSSPPDSIANFLLVSSEPLRPWLELSRKNLQRLSSGIKTNHIKRFSRAPTHRLQHDDERPKGQCVCAKSLRFCTKLPAIWLSVLSQLIFLECNHVWYSPSCFCVTAYNCVMCSV